MEPYRQSVAPEHGPRIAAIGGGTGLSTLLRGLKRDTKNITAIVTVADDGGGSGRLRQDLGMLPPGDIRNCLEALANAEPLMAQLMHYRFPEGELAGQSVLGAFRDLTGLTEEQCWGLGSGLGSGMRCGGICGAVSGGVLVLGLLHPYTAQEGPEGRRRSVEQVKEFQRRFTQQFHLLNCRELLAERGLHPTPTAQAAGADDHCGTLIVSAVELLCDYLAELDQK